eukprot:9834591-Alexandrium_andersonii.AAC.1
MLHFTHGGLRSWADFSTDRPSADFGLHIGHLAMQACQTVLLFTGNQRLCVLRSRARAVLRQPFVSML